MSQSKLQNFESNPQTQDRPLADQNMALQSYMQELLNEVAWVEPEPAARKLEAPLNPAESIQVCPVAEVPNVPLARDMKQTLDELELECLQDDQESGLEKKYSTDIENGLVNHDNKPDSDQLGDQLLEEGKVPDWAGSSFRALYTNNGRLRLVMPLLHVQTVVKGKELVRAANSSNAIMGYVQRGPERIPVLDVNRLTSGNPQADDIHSGDGYIAIAENMAVGLFFGKIDDTFEVTSSAISWRCNDESANWIAGVDPETLAIIVDFDCLRDLV